MPDRISREDTADRISSYNDLYLLQEICFHFDKYTPEARELFHSEMSTRGFDSQSLEHHRRRFLKVHAAQSHCPQCHARIVLELVDLLKGQFLCPACHKAESVHYEESWFRRISDRLSDLQALKRVQKTALPFKSDPFNRAELEQLETIFAALSDEQLLNVLAFEANSYSEAAISILTDIAHVRDVTDAQVQDYRRSHLVKDVILETECVFCERGIRLERRAAITGHFVCGKCGNAQPVLYKSAWFEPV